MAKAPAIGIQQFVRLMCVSLAKVNVGMAIKATIAGRIPAKIDAIIGLF